jgi:signal transduction histidine kinase/ActR/RegA family two-component response regulator
VLAGLVLVPLMVVLGLLLTGPGDARGRGDPSSLGEAQAQAPLRMIELTEAEFRLRPRDAWQPVPLPDTWARRGLADTGLGHYRIEFTLGARPAGLWVLCIPRMSRVHELRLNGELLGGALIDPFERPPGDTGGRDHLVSVPPHLLQAGLNRIELSVVHSRNAGLSMLMLGPPQAMPAGARLIHQMTWIPASLYLVGAGLAVFMLAIWWRRPSERTCGQFGLIWMLCLLMHGLVRLSPPQPDALHDGALLLLQIAALALGASIVLRLSGRLQSASAGVVQATLLLMVALALWGASTGVLDEVRLWLHPMLILVCALLMPLAWSGCQRLPGPARLLLAGLLLGLLIAAGHDHLVWVGMSSVMDHYWLPLALPLALLAIGSLMIRRLVEALRQVEQLNADLERRVAERTAALQQANQAKTRFLAAASHDLRQPVVTISLLIDLLREQVPVPLRPMTDRVDEAVSSMEDLLKGLLDLSRLEAGTVRPRPQSVALQPLFDAIAAHEGETARRKGLKLRLRPSPATVVSDPVLLEQILRNLVSNAVRYTERGGVLVGVRRRGERLQLDVIDTGVGIAQEDQDAVFEEFVQLDTPIGAPRRALGDSSRGLGLGLSIVQRSCALLGHRLLLNSRPGQGSRFSVQLESVTPLPALPAPALPRRLPLQGLRLTVVEDEPAVQDALRARLQAWGAVVQCHDGLAPLRHQLAQRPRGHSGIDLLITDHRLRGASGLDVVEAVRSYGGPVPVLVITGDTSPGDLSLLSASGLQVLHKPFRAEALLAAIEQVLATAETFAVLTGRAAPGSPPRRRG